MRHGKVKQGGKAIKFASVSRLLGRATGLTPDPLRGEVEPILRAAPARGEKAGRESVSPHSCPGWLRANPGCVNSPALGPAHGPRELLKLKNLSGTRCRDWEGSQLRAQELSTGCRCCARGPKGTGHWECLLHPSARNPTPILQGNPGPSLTPSIQLRPIRSNAFFELW